MAKELERKKTGFEDGTYWVIYEASNGKIFYEIDDDIDGVVISEDRIKDKINIEDLPIKKYVESILDTYYDLCNLFYDDEDEDSVKEFEEAIELIEETLEIYPRLEKYIEIWEDEISFNGTIITEILF